MAKRAGMPWDGILSAEVFRAYKPDAATYRGVARTFDLAPQQVMPVAAHHDDLSAARECGLRTGYVERPLELGAGHPKDAPPQAANDVPAQSLVALAHTLGTGRQAAFGTCRSLHGTAARNTQLLRTQ